MSQDCKPGNIFIHDGGDFPGFHVVASDHIGISLEVAHGTPQINLQRANGSHAVALIGRENGGEISISDNGGRSALRAVVEDRGADGTYVRVMVGDEIVFERILPPRRLPEAEEEGDA